MIDVARWRNLYLADQTIDSVESSKELYDYEDEIARQYYSYFEPLKLGNEHLFLLATEYLELGEWDRLKPLAKYENFYRTCLAVYSDILAQIQNPDSAARILDYAIYGTYNEGMLSELGNLPYSDDLAASGCAVIRNRLKCVWENKGFSNDDLLYLGWMMYCGPYSKESKVLPNYHLLIEEYEFEGRIVEQYYGIPGYVLPWNMIVKDVCDEIYYERTSVNALLAFTVLLNRNKRTN